jgi:hypothetical protein
VSGGQLIVTSRSRPNQPLGRNLRLPDHGAAGSNGLSNRSPSSPTSRVGRQDVVDPQWPRLLHLVARAAHECVRVPSLLRHLVGD